MLTNFPITKPAVIRTYKHDIRYISNAFKETDKRDIIIIIIIIIIITTEAREITVCHTFLFVLINE
jgi:hypothetical protein